MLIKRKEYYPTLFNSDFLEIFNLFSKDSDLDFILNKLNNKYDYNSVVKHDYYETSDDFVFEIPLPGLKKEDISIEINKNFIKIQAEKKEVENVKYFAKSSYSNSYQLSYQIPENTDKENIDATMENGMLKIKIPKIQKKKDDEKFKIAIK